MPAGADRSRGSHDANVDLVRDGGSDGRDDDAVLYESLDGATVQRGILSSRNGVHVARTSVVVVCSQFWRQRPSLPAGDVEQLGFVGRLAIVGRYNQGPAIPALLTLTKFRRDAASFFCRPY